MSRKFLSGNKGVFFSLIAILLLVLIAMQFIGRQRIVVQSEFDVLDTQFQIANELVNNVERSILPR
ncbi:MAG: hypothetical protein AABY13_00860, partial [Nanoarchaeota archaeon]